MSDDAQSRLWELTGDIRDVLRRVIELEAENEELRKIKDKYDELLMSSIKHGEAMMGHLLVATLNGNLVKK